MKLTPLFLAGVIVAGSCTVAMAQDQPRRQPGDAPRRMPQAPQRLSEEQLHTIWKHQAATVAGAIGLAEEKTGQLANAYVESRTRLAEAQRPAGGDGPRPGRGDRPGMGSDNPDRPERPEAGQQGQRGDRRPGMRDRAQEMRERAQEALKAEQAKFKSTIEGFLNADQVQVVMSSLGTFDRRWDQLIHALHDLMLGEEKFKATMTPVYEYIVAINKKRDTDDREAVRQAAEEARQKLLDALKPILTEEQLKQVEQSFNRRGGRNGQAPDGAGGGMFQRLDANGDGVIEKSELPERMQEMFDRLDANGDGVLDEDELGAMRRRGRGQSDDDF